MDKFAEYLKPTFFLDFDHPDVIAYANTIIPIGSKQTPVDIAVNLYNAVRDDIYYTTYGIEFTEEAFKASNALKNKTSFCIPKAVLFAALLRYFKIPSRLFFADVKNHFTSEKLLRAMKTNVFVYHGGAEVLLNNHWLKATPAFNKSLCEKLNVKVLEFDGKSDSIFQQFNNEGNEFMEYIKFHGSFSDVPIKDIKDGFYKAYPDLFKKGGWPKNG